MAAVGTETGCSQSHQALSPPHGHHDPALLPAGVWLQDNHCPGTCCDHWKYPADTSSGVFLPAVGGESPFPSCRPVLFAVTTWTIAALRESLLPLENTICWSSLSSSRTPAPGAGQGHSPRRRKLDYLRPSQGCPALSGFLPSPDVPQLQCVRETAMDQRWLGRGRRDHPGEGRMSNPAASAGSARGEWPLPWGCRAVPAAAHRGTSRWGPQAMGLACRLPPSPLTQRGAELSHASREGTGSSRESCCSSSSGIVALATGSREPLRQWECAKNKCGRIPRRELSVQQKKVLLCG